MTRQALCDLRGGVEWSAEWAAWVYLFSIHSASPQTCWLKTTHIRYLSFCGAGLDVSYLGPLLRVSLAEFKVSAEAVFSSEPLPSVLVVGRIHFLVP